MEVDPSRAIWLSVQVAAWCTVLGLPFALPLGWLLARREFRGKSLVNVLIMAPLVLPPVVTGLLLLEALGRNSFIGAHLERLGHPLSFSFAGAVLAAFTVGMPLYVMAIRSAFESVDPKLEEMAMTLGSRPFAVFRRVTLPLAFPGILAGSILAFARALGEFGATVVIAGNMEGETRTIALAVYTLLDSPAGAGSARLLVLSSLGISLGALACYEYLLRSHRMKIELPNAR